MKRAGHIFLLVTLDKSGHAEDFQYHDRFLDRTKFEWQSQNRTAPDSADGRDIKNHRERDIAVHLFVRTQKKRSGGRSAPFIYCGDVVFQSWQGEKPITVRWQLPVPVPDHIWNAVKAGP